MCKRHKGPLKCHIKKCFFNALVEGGRPNADEGVKQMLTIADEEGRGVRQLLTIADEGGRGV